MRLEYVSRKEFMAHLRDDHMCERVGAQKSQHTIMDQLVFAGLNERKALFGTIS